MCSSDLGHLQFFGDHLRLADKAAFKAYLRPLREIDWVVYAKEPFGRGAVLRLTATREGLDDDQAATAAWARHWQSARLIGFGGGIDINRGEDAP